MERLHACTTGDCPEISPLRLERSLSPSAQILLKWIHTIRSYGLSSSLLLTANGVTIHSLAPNTLSARFYSVPERIAVGCGWRPSVECIIDVSLPPAMARRQIHLEEVLETNVTSLRVLPTRIMTWRIRLSTSNNTISSVSGSIFGEGSLSIAPARKLLDADRDRKKLSSTESHILGGAI